MPIKHTVLLYTIQAVIVLTVVLCLIFTTQNPLAILGLMFLWAAPPIVGQSSEDDDGDNDEDVVSNPIGFVHNDE